MPCSCVILVQWCIIPGLCVFVLFFNEFVCVVLSSHRKPFLSTYTYSGVPFRSACVLSRLDTESRFNLYTRKYLFEVRVCCLVFIRKAVSIYFVYTLKYRFISVCELLTHPIGYCCTLSCGHRLPISESLCSIYIYRLLLLLLILTIAHHQRPAVVTNLTHLVLRGKSGYRCTISTLVRSVVPLWVECNGNGLPILRRCIIVLCVSFFSLSSAPSRLP